MLQRESNIQVGLFHAALLAAADSKLAGVRSVGNISVDFTELDLSTFERKSLLGTPLYKLQYDVNVIFGAQEGVLKFEAVSQGKVVGETSISFHRPGFY
jgi:hypothetical protein